MFGVDDAEVDELYAAMDWLGKRQNRIQGKLARRHFRDGGLVLFDLIIKLLRRDGPLALSDCCASLGLRGQYRGSEDPS